MKSFKIPCEIGEEVELPFGDEWEILLVDRWSDEYVEVIARVRPLNFVWPDVSFAGEAES